MSPVTLTGELPRSVSFDPGYWLRRCEGFEVRTPERRLGVIREVRYRSCLDRPDEIVVCSGVFRNREDVVPVPEVAEILPGDQTILLRSRPEPVPYRLPRLRLRRV